MGREMTTNVDAGELGISFSEVARSKLLEVLTGYPEEVAGLRLKITAAPRRDSSTC